jgi:hypothetical protein
MRKQLFTLSLLSVAAVASAQTTITWQDQPALLSVYHQALDTTGLQSPGNSGTNQTWAYGSLLNQQEDSMTFTLPQWTPEGANFPSSNLAIMQNQGDAYVYSTMTTTSLEIDGQAADPFGNGVITLSFSNPETQMVFPASYGVMFTDTAGGVNQFYLGYDPGIGFPIDSVRIHTTITKESEFDGWGTVTTPYGTFNTLRQNTLRTQIDTIDLYFFGVWSNAAYSQEDIARTYSYWTNGIGFPVVELIDQGDEGQISRATWLPAAPMVTGVPVNDNSTTSVAYPNPATDVLTIETAAGEGTIELIDVTGRVVKSAVINSNLTRMDVTDLSSGMYVYRVNGVTQGKVQVAH